MQPDDIIFLVSLFMVAAVLQWLIPSCGHPRCVEAHNAHRVTDRAADIERTHAIYHSPDRPQPLCVLCQGRRRDDDE